jgi:hypothetical protein
MSAVATPSAQRVDSRTHYLPDLDWGDPREEETLPGHTSTGRAVSADERSIYEEYWS